MSEDYEEDDLFLPNIEFDAVGWRVRVEEYLSAYRGLIDLLTDQKAMESHSKSIKKEIESRRDDDLLSQIFQQIGKPFPTDVFVSARLSDVFGTFNIFSRQSIVVLASFLEAVINDFFYCVFCCYPSRMHQYLRSDHDEHLVGKVDLKDILDSSSMPSLMIKLASDSASNAGQGKYKSVLKRLSNVTKNVVDEKESFKTVEIVETRNRILHELSEEKLDPKYVLNAFGIVEEFITYLENAAVQMDIPIFTFPDGI